MIDFTKLSTECEAYLSASLGSPARLVRAEPLAKSTRAAPWRLDVEVNGMPRSFVLRWAPRVKEPLPPWINPGSLEHEFLALRAIEALSIPTPRAYGYDPEGQALGVPCFFCDFIEGTSLLGPMLAGEAWAEDLYIEAVCSLQNITREQVSLMADRLEEITAVDVLEKGSHYFTAHPDPLAGAVYAKLKATLPSLPASRFSNGDLWLENFIVRDRELVGIIDFETAGFSDPIYEFLLSFFHSPELRGRGTEDRYCRRMGFDPAWIDWYHGLEYFDTWRWVLSSGQPFAQYNAENLLAALKEWLEER